MARAAKTTELDVDAMSADVTQRFDDIAWDRFNSSDWAARSDTRHEVLRIRDDLMKVAAVDPSRAAQIWDEHVPDYVPRPLDLPNSDIDDGPVNVIEPGRRRRRTMSEIFLDTVSISNSAAPAEAKSGPEAGVGAGQKVPPQDKDASKDGASAESPEEARARLLLDGLDKLYLKADDRYHFRDKGGEVAFEAREKKLLTLHDTPSVVTSMIDLAETRGWSALKLTGTEEFRREAWLQANLRHFEVSGYQPTKLDRARLEELRTERPRAPAANSIEVAERLVSRRTKDGVQFDAIPEEGKGEPRIPLTPAQDQFLRAMEATMRHRGDAPQAIAKARELANERLRSDRIHVGKLVEVGTAPYQDRQGARLSHFVALEDNDRVRTKVWGVDLPRALADSQAQVGQMVALAFKGRQPVSVDVPVRSGSGEVVSSEKQTVNRNSWDIVQFDRLRDEAKASVFKAVERQENPAALKVFDRSARPLSTQANQTRPREHSRERSL